MKPKDTNLHSDIQNVFTAYLQTAATRKRIKYMERMSLKESREVSVEVVWDQNTLADEMDILCFLPLENQIGDDNLSRVITNLSRQDYQILCLRVLAGLQFPEIAEILHLGLFTVKNRYNSVVKRLRKGREDT